MPRPAQELVSFGARPPTSWLRVGPAPARLRPPTLTYSRVSHWPAHTCPSVEGGEWGAWRSAQVRARRRRRRKVTAGRAGGWGEDARRTGGPTDEQTDRWACGQPGSSPGARLRPQPWSSGCVRWSGWRGARPAAARDSTASWICCWGCTTSSAAPPCGESATWRSS